MIIKCYALKNDIFFGDPDFVILTNFKIKYLVYFSIS